MDNDALEAAAELCRMVEAPDLLAWLGVSATTSVSDIKTSLERQRKRMQSMQGNPKYREVATFLIKNFRRIDEVLTDIPAYLEGLAAEQSSTQLPLLELAIDGVLADGVLTTDEAIFVRDQALKLGIAIEVYERILRERCEARGVQYPDNPGRPASLPPHAVISLNSGSFRVPLRTLQSAHRAAGTGWWDDAFSRLLLQQVPGDAKRMVDLSCGLGWAALSLMPGRPQLEYLGIDPNELHVDVARRNLTQAGLADRAMVQRADPANLPLPDHQVDVVTCIMSLQTVTDSRPLFRQTARILRPGGRMVVVEPDCLGQRFWFDGNLPDFDDAFRELCMRVDALLADGSGVDDPLGQPGLALGPQLGARMRAAGIDPATTTIHPVQVAQHCTLPAFVRRLRKRIEAMREAGSLETDDPAVTGAYDVLDDLEQGRPGATVGTGVHLLPLFVVVGYAD